jgi:acetyl-CoA C-acetyltransferase
MPEAFIFDHVRTPRGRGKPDGGLHAVTPAQLAAQALGALRDRNGLDTALVDDVLLGCVSPVGEQGADIARVAVPSSPATPRRSPASRSTGSAPRASRP